MWGWRVGLVVRNFTSGGEASDLNQNVKQCDIDFNRTVSDATQCDGTSAYSTIGYFRSMALGVICTGMFIFGVTKGPRMGLSFTYIDDNVEQTKAGYHFGFINGMWYLGPPIAAAVGAYFNNVYITLNDTPLTPRDPRWIGAWWVGFIVFGFVMSLVSITLICYPRSYRNVKQVKTDFKAMMKNFPSDLLGVIKIPVYGMVGLATAIKFFYTGGTRPFYPKYLELQFKLLPASANTILGIINAAMFFGPPVMIAVGSYFNDVYVTLNDTPLTPRDPRWIGAWWLGFIVFGFVMSLVSITLICYPRSYRNVKKVKTDFRAMIKDFPSAVLRIVKIPVYSMIGIATAIKFFYIAGVIPFYPKYLELQFKLLPSLANRILGISSIAGGVVASIISGIIVSRLQLGVRGMLKTIVICTAISLVGYIASIFISCERTEFHGHERFGIANSDLSCNTNCTCDDNDFLPICGDDGLTYFSPCHAGCSRTANKTDGVFSGCGCMGGNKTGIPQLCEAGCTSLIPYAVVLFLVQFFDTFIFIPVFITMLRLVPEADKPLSVGFSNIPISLIGWMAGPLVFGRVIDTTCLLWNENCGERGACSIYDTDSLRIKFHALVAGAASLSLILYIVAYVIVVTTGQFVDDVDNEKGDGVKKDGDEKNGVELVSKVSRL